VAVRDTTITRVSGRRALAAGGFRAIEAEVHLDCGASGRAVVPAIASTVGRSVATGIREITTLVDPALHGLDAQRRDDIDASLLRLNTYSPMRVGTEVLAACSIAAMRAAADAAGQPLFKYLQPDASRIPLPVVATLRAYDPGAVFCRLAVIPACTNGAEEALDACAAIHAAALELAPDSLAGTPAFGDDERGLELLVTAIERAGFVPGEEIAIAAELHAARLYRNGRYRGPHGEARDSDAWGELLTDWVARYPIAFLEDPFAAADRTGQQRFVRALGSLVRVGGHELLACDAERIADAAAESLCGALIAAPEEVGTMGELLAAFEAARAAGWDTAIAADAEGGDDAAAVHIAVGWNASLIKLGSIADPASVARWNELLRVEAGLRPPLAFARAQAAARMVH
jgi:enolase 1/2/3